MQILTSALVGALLLSGTGAADAASQPPSTPTYTVSMTAYNAVPGQTDDTPDTTSVGAHANPDIVAARSGDLADELPYGTVIAIDTATSSSPSCGIALVKPFIGYRVIADAMNARMRNKVDILLGTDDRVMVGNRSVNAANAFGHCRNISIRVVGHVDVSKMPKTQEELARLIDKPNTLAVAK